MSKPTPTEDVQVHITMDLEKIKKTLEKLNYADEKLTILHQSTFLRKSVDWVLKFLFHGISEFGCDPKIGVALDDYDDPEVIKNASMPTNQQIIKLLEFCLQNLLRQPPYPMKFDGEDRFVSMGYDFHQIREIAGDKFESFREWLEAYAEHHESYFYDMILKDDCKINFTYDDFGNRITAIN